MGYAGAWHIDHARFAQERMPPALYLTSSYYERWLFAVETNATERGLVDTDELAAGHALRPGQLLPRKLTREIVEAGLGRGSFYREPQGPQRFRAGDRVKTKVMSPPSHTRLPRYARGKSGVVQLCHGCHMFPDSVVSGRGDDPQWLYTVVFESRELWGADADPTVTVSIEAFEPYLDPRDG
jgi:nitrile hydratase